MEEFDSNCGIYELFNVITGMRYIGSAVNIKRRWGEHNMMLVNNKHHSIKLQNAFNKYGRSAFDFRKVHTVMPSLLILVEQFYIDSYDFNNDLYNICPTAGSQLGKKLSDEHRRKISEARKGKKGKKLSDEHRKKMSEVLKGRKLSDEHRKKMSEVLKGRKLSDETRRKMSEAGKGKKLSDETRKKISEAMKGKKYSKLKK